MEAPMSFVKSKNTIVVALIICSFLLTAPLAAGQDPGGAKDPLSEAKDKAAKQAAEQAEKALAEKIKQELAVTTVEPYVSEAKAKPEDPDSLGAAGMGDSISVVIPGLWFAAEHKVIDPTKLVLYVDGRVFKDVHPTTIGRDNVVFKLERTKDAMDAWNGLLGSPRLEEIKKVVVSAGALDQGPLQLSKKFQVENGAIKPNLKLIVYRKGWAVFSLIVLIALVFLFFKYGRKNLLRDSGPPNPPPGKSRPYSLAKTQVAWWTFIIIGSFLLIYMITGEFTMTEQALILMGIGTGTALGATMIDNSKRTNSDNELETLNPQRARAKAELDALDQQIAAAEQALAANPAATETDKAALQAQKVNRAEKAAQLNVIDVKIGNAQAGLQQPTSEGPWTDLVTDANGPSFHRFQMIVWTFILGALFLVGVFRSLAMPEFSGTLLALMGISAGTYLGFKIPEQQSKGDQTMAEGAAATKTTTTTTGPNGTGAKKPDAKEKVDAAAGQLDGH
jgi:hypothetical protein